MYPISNEVKALFESEQKQILRITGGEKSPISKSVGPSTMASFSDAIAAGALNLSVDITPVQSGSGDPSPTNVRPISGWTGAKVTVSPSQNAQDGTTYDITFPTEAGMVYGGTLDVTSGLLTITHKAIVLDGTISPFRTETQSATNNFRCDFANTSQIFGGDYPVKPSSTSLSVKSDRFSSYVDRKRKDSWNAFITGDNWGFLTFNFDPNIVENSVAGVDAWFASNPTTIVYELATPITYQLTPIQIALLAGVNNVWADCGDVTVEYATGYEYEINITDADVVIGSFSIDRFSCIGNKLEVGTATSAQMTVKLDNYDGRFNGIVFEGTELFVEIGIADWTQSNPTVNWIPHGYFTPDEQPRSYNNITLHCLDRMMRFDVTSPTMLPWTDNYGNQITDNYGNPLYFNAELAFPATVKATIEEIAVRCGMTVSTDLTTLPNYDYVIQSLPVAQRTITYRTLVQWCAALMGTCAFVDWNGGLAFKWYEAVDYTATIENRFSSDLHENDITITGVSFTNLNDVEIVSGDADYTIDLTGNYLITNNESTLLPVINTAVNGFTYRPFSADVINAPYLWPMDVITFTDKDGSDYNCAVTNVNFGLNTYTALSGVGETDQSNKGVAPSGLTRQQAQLIDSVVNVLDDSLDQQEIFNRLTDNGAAQGLLLYNGQLYINASYMNVGELNAALVKITNLTADDISSGIIHSADYRTTPVPMIYPASTLYPSSTTYPSNGEYVTSGFAIDFETGQIYGGFYSAQIAALQSAVSDLQSTINAMQSALVYPKALPTSVASFAFEPMGARLSKLNIPEEDE